jgi:hypothetical protein
VARDLRPVYTAVNEDDARARLEEFYETWAGRYPAIRTLWDNAWNEFVPFLDYSIDVRRVIYSTNAIESLHARMRRATRARGHFPTEQAAMKCLYLVVRSLDPTGKGAHRWMNRWKPALNAFAVTFEGRSSQPINDNRQRQLHRYPDSPAVEAAVQARVRAVVLWDAPEDLNHACEGIDAGLTVIPRRVVGLGALAPRLTPRQREILRVLARGTPAAHRRGAPAIGIHRQARYC